MKRPGLALVPASAASALLAASVTFAGPSSYERPLSDFLSRQGTTTVQTAPVPDYLAWTDVAAGVMMAVDYAGIANAWTEAQTGGTFSYGTTITGRIIERPRADGRADVQIIIHAENALCYVVGFDAVNGPDYSDVRFGNLAPEALALGDAALGDCDFQIRIINTAPGAPLPDLFDAFVLGNGDPRLGLDFIRFNARASGTLHAGALPGVTEDTAGDASVIQTGIFMSGFHGSVGDGFPAEKIRMIAR
jgi:hypothetical protein